MNNNLFDKPVIDPQDVTRQLYTNWRERFALPLLIGVLIFGLGALIPALISSTNMVLNSFFIISYLFTLVVTIIRFSYFIRMLVFLLSIYMLGVSTLLTYNALGVSLFYFLALIIFSTMMLSIRAGIIAIAIDVVTYTFFGWLILS
ncbi:MAG TPA: hypothetical protein DEP19_04325, partial [Anaerolineae bacterium]|nr:hypothetical protein [Anaerolineae bacterium]